VEEGGWGRVKLTQGDLEALGVRGRPSRKYVEIVTRINVCSIQPNDPADRRKVGERNTETLGWEKIIRGRTITGGSSRKSKAKGRSKNEEGQGENTQLKRMLLNEKQTLSHLATRHREVYVNHTHQSIFRVEHKTLVWAS